MSLRNLIGLPMLLLAGCDSAGNFRLPPVSQTSHATGLEVARAESAPVLERGASGEFDAVDVLNPSVVRGADGVLWNFYSGFDGRTWHTGAAKFVGDRWTKLGRVLSPQGCAPRSVCRLFEEAKQDQHIFRRLGRDGFSIRETFQGHPVFDHPLVPQLPPPIVIVRQLGDGT